MASRYRAGGSGRFVSKPYAKKHPRTTMKERVGAGTHNTKPVNRSTISGRFVTKATARRHPGTTVTQWV